MQERIEALSKTLDDIREAVSKVIVGQEGMVEKLLNALLCNGHVLLEGVPGIAKTMMVNCLAGALNARFNRIQFTPDLLPGDVVGTQIYRAESGTFETSEGPIFANLVLADEINRSPAKVQSALLEAMQEEKVTVFGTEYGLSPPFMVLATQNPIEMEGTYPLPEAQIDRFFFKLKIHYPSKDHLIEIIDKTTEDYQPEFSPVIGADEILEMKRVIKHVPIATHVKDYAIRLVMASHPDNENSTEKIKEYVQYGASPRGVQSLVLAGKVGALLEGRFNVSVEDIRSVVKPALRHRMVLNIKGEAEGLDEDLLIDEIIEAQG